MKEITLIFKEILAFTISLALTLFVTIAESIVVALLPCIAFYYTENLWIFASIAIIEIIIYGYVYDRIIQK